jgi:hypothetical protein
MSSATSWPILRLFSGKWMLRGQGRVSDLETLLFLRTVYVRYDFNGMTISPNTSLLRRALSHGDCWRVLFGFHHDVV